MAPASTKWKPLRPVGSAMETSMAVFPKRLLHAFSCATFGESGILAKRVSFIFTCQIWQGSIIKYCYSLIIWKIWLKFAIIHAVADSGCLKSVVAAFGKDMSDESEVIRVMKKTRSCAELQLLDDSFSAK